MRQLFLLCTLAVVVFSRHPFEAKTKCDDPHYSCPSSATCCKLSDGSYGCCPIKNAVCCEDGEHCCPEGSQCDVEEGRCLQGEIYVPIHRKHPAHRKPEPNQDNVCPDKKSKCPGGTTCCQLTQGTWGCCPVPDAVCCPDRMHCCPNGFRCDSSGERCMGVDTDEVLPWFKKYHATPLKQKTGVHMWNEESEEREEDEYIKEALYKRNGQSVGDACGLLRCPVKSTCCAVEGQFGRIHYMCCPLTNGVCCDSFCCPSGYHCAANRKCEKKAHNPFVEMVFN